MSLASWLSRVRSLNSLVAVVSEGVWNRGIVRTIAMPRKRKAADREEGVDGGGMSKDPSLKPPEQKKRKKETKEKGSGKKAESGGDKNKTDWASVKWAELGTTKDGRPWNKKFSSWNVNGIRAWLKNGGFDYIAHEDPDIFCVQETKCAEAELPLDQLEVDGYQMYWHSANKKGYSGVGLYSKEKPVKVTKGIGIEKYDCEGRLIIAEFDTFFFLTSYVPNAGEGLKRLDYKQEWDTDLRALMKKLDAEKPVILCGDLNVAHQEIDLKNPKSNHKTAGFTPEERQDFSLLLQEGFVDVFRQLYPDMPHAYTYWSYRFNARAKDTGWRLDYYVVSERLLEHVSDCVIRKQVFGSDHCPLVLGLALPPSSSSSLPRPDGCATEGKAANNPSSTTATEGKAADNPSSTTATEGKAADNPSSTTATEGKAADNPSSTTADCNQIEA